MADLKTIISITQAELKRNIPTQQAMTDALESLTAREADVLSRRTGLRDGKSETLAQIGEGLSVTRERVRQIEAGARKKLAVEAKKKPLSEILGLAHSLVREHGGVIAEEVLEAEFLPSSQQTPGGQAALTLLLELTDDVKLMAAQKGYRPFYATSTAHERAVSKVGPVLEKTLASAKQPLKASELFAKVTGEDLNGVGYLITEPFTESTLEIATGFVLTPENKWGLATWADINPRNIREKTLFMLKKVGTPLHFSEITENIRTAKFDAKKVTTQAVHNELINGDEFVLIGRGIYALRDWGYLPGTVAEVITDILKKASGPVERDQIIEQVLKQRHVSRNTIIINLQDKSHFARVGKSRYQLAS